MYENKSSNFWLKFLFLITNRFILLILFFVISVVIQYICFQTILPSNETKDLWFYSGLFMLTFSLLFIEPYYTSPKNVLANAMPLLLVLISTKPRPDDQSFWLGGSILLLILVLSSIIALALNNENLSQSHIRNRISNFLKKGVVLFGQGRVLYSIFFVYFLLSYYSIQDFYTITLFLFWGVILIINPKGIHNSFIFGTNKKTENQIGEIFGVQYKKFFLFKLFTDIQNINKFDIVKFHYSMQNQDQIFNGLVFDTYLLNNEKWGKILQLSEFSKIDEDKKLKGNYVYKINDPVEFDKLTEELRINEIVGIVTEKSNIEKIFFEYSKMVDDLQEGDLLELKIGEKRLFYQVINGLTDIDNLEDKNKMGYIQGEAIQLGEWDIESLSFQKYGWVPSINTPVYKANTNDIPEPDFEYPDYKLGIIPGSTLPAIIDLNEAISHHMALLGITGAGKSFLARQMINKIQHDTKIICVDFNKEFTTTLTPCPPNIISETIANSISPIIDLLSVEQGKYTKDKSTIEKISHYSEQIKDILTTEIDKFLGDTKNNISVFELPDMSNSTAILDYTKFFFRVLFEIAKEKQQSGNSIKLCVVLEEAHTIIPEWNFLGSSDKSSQALVNSIGQIALQGRKYGVGFIVIAQRTANVSKTVLTQCNTVICFQAFDDTSFNFLGNYVGKNMVQTLPNLKKFHAIVSGKAVKSNVPMIVDLTVEDAIPEDSSENTSS